MSIKYCSWTTGNDWSGSGGADNGGYTGSLNAWSSAGVGYSVGTRVHYGAADWRSIWRCIQNHTSTSTLPRDLPAYWVLVADGTAAYPWRSIHDADDGLTGGDEVRISKSPARVSAGNLVWTDNSPTITLGTGNVTDLTTIFAARQFVIKNSSTGPGDPEPPWEISTVTSSTITLVYSYAGTSTDAAGVASSCIGITDTGVSAGSSTTIQSYGTSGSYGNPLVISGGWDLVAEAASPSAAGTRGNATGETWFYQSGVSNKYGYAVQGSGSPTYVNITDIGILRYNYGVTWSGYGVCGVTVERVTTASNASYCIQISNVAGSYIVKNCCLAANTSWLAQLGIGGSGCLIENCYFVRQTSNSAVHIYAMTNSKLLNNTFIRCNGPWYLTGCSNLLISGANGSTSPGNVATGGHRLIVKNSGPTIVTLPGADNSRPNLYGYGGPIWFCPDWLGTPGNHQITWPLGAYGFRSATDGPGGFPCLSIRVNLSSTLYGIHTGDIFSRYCPAGKDATLSVALMRSGTYTSGDVQLGVYAAGDNVALVADTTVAVTTSWDTYNVVVPASQLATEKMVELRVTMKRQAGSDLLVSIAHFCGIPMTNWDNAKPIFPAVFYGTSGFPMAGVM